MATVPGYITPYPNGISSFGVPLVGSSDFYHATRGRHWWVNSVVSLFQDGQTPLTPFATMAQAFAVISSGDVIHCNGNVREQLDTPVGIFDVTIIGEQNLPRNADAHTGNNGTIAAFTWKLPASPSQTTPLLRVLQQGWRFVNILFNGPTTSSCVKLFRDNGAGDAERDASHASFYGCRFEGGQDHINVVEVAFVLVQDCQFGDATGTAYLSSAGSGIANPLRHRIYNSVFMGNANGIKLAGNQCAIQGNVMGKFTTKSIDLTGGTGDNVVTKNYLSGTYSSAGGYTVAAASDEWAGNFNSLAGGITAADPA